MSLDGVDRWFREDVFTWDNALHVAGGAALSSLLLLPLWYSAPLVFLIWGWMREGAQHREDGAWIGFVTPGRATEAVAWSVGAAILYAFV